MTRIWAELDYKELLVLLLSIIKNFGLLAVSVSKEGSSKPSNIAGGEVKQILKPISHIPQRDI